MHSSSCCQDGPSCSRRWLCIGLLWCQSEREEGEWLSVFLPGECWIREGKGGSARGLLQPLMEWEWEWDCGGECSGLLLLQTLRGSSEGRVCFPALLDRLSFLSVMIHPNFSFPSLVFPRLHHPQQHQHLSQHQSHHLFQPSQLSQQPRRNHI